MKRILRVSIVIALIIVACTAAAFAASSGVKVILDGQELPFNEDMGIPYIDENGRTMVPVRLPLETFGCEVQWVGATRSVVITKDNTIVELQIGVPEIKVNGNRVPIDTKPVIINGRRTYLPIRAVFEAYGAVVTWDKKEKNVKIFSTQELYDQWNNTQVQETTRTFSFNYPYPDGTGCTVSFTLNDDLYKKYSTQQRHDMYYVKDYAQYYYDSRNDGFAEYADSVLDECAKKLDLNEFETLNLILTFVQSIKYVDDIDWKDKYEEYPKYPLETLYDQCGDCEDKVILLGAILKARGYNVAYVVFPGHMLLGVGLGGGATGDYYYCNGTRYYYAETTADGWKIGELLERFKSKTPEIYVLE